MAQCLTVTKTFSTEDKIRDKHYKEHKEKIDKLALQSFTLN